MISRPSPPMSARKNITSALLSRTEICVDPREVVAKLPKFLAETHNVDFHFSTVATQVKNNVITTSRGEIQAEKNLHPAPVKISKPLYPDWYAQSGLQRCKLQMRRAIGNDWNLGTMLCAGLYPHPLRLLQILPHPPPTQSFVRKRAPRLHPPQHPRHGLPTRHRAGHDRRQPRIRRPTFPLQQRRDRPPHPRLPRQIPRHQPTPNPRKVARRLRQASGHRPTSVTNPDPSIEIVTSPGGAGMTLSFGVGEDSLATHTGQVLTHA